MAFNAFVLWSDKNHLRGSIKMSDKFQMTSADSFYKLTGNYTSERTLFRLQKLNKFFLVPLLIYIYIYIVWRIFLNEQFVQIPIVCISTKAGNVTSIRNWTG